MTAINELYLNRKALKPFFIFKTDRIFRRVLRFLYGFDKWHVYKINDAYKNDIISFCNNAANRNSVMEIGCGTGDIIRKLHFHNRIGYDISQEVLNAARIYSLITFQRKMKFAKFNFLQNEVQGVFDIIILVNWIHEISPDILKAKIDNLFENHCQQNGYLIVDTVQDTGYRYNHDIELLKANLECEEIKLGDYFARREIFAIKKIGVSPRYNQ